MRVYKPKSWLTYLRMIIVVFCLLVISGSTLYSTSSKTVKNENLSKAVELELIEENQNDLYKVSYDAHLFEPINSFMGELTGYAGDCPLCSGIVACKRINVLKEGIYYEDKEYGTVRMVASSKKYPCGTILKFNVNKIQEEPIIAIVMDRGVGGNVIDLLSESQDYARKKIGRVKNLEFEILRSGWNKK